MNPRLRWGEIYNPPPPKVRAPGIRGFLEQYLPPELMEMKRGAKDTMHGAKEGNKKAAEANAKRKEAAAKAKEAKEKAAKAQEEAAKAREAGIPDTGDIPDTGTSRV